MSWMKQDQEEKAFIKGEKMIDLIVTIAVLIGCLKLFPKLYKEIHKLD